MAALPADFGGFCAKADEGVYDCADDDGAEEENRNGNSNIGSSNGDGDDAEVIKAYRAEVVKVYRHRVLNKYATSAEGTSNNGGRNKPARRCHVHLTPCLCRYCARPRYLDENVEDTEESVRRIPFVEVYRRSTTPQQKPIVLTNFVDAGDGETLWELVDMDMLAILPAELTDPLLSLEEAMKALRTMLGATARNIALNFLTLSAYGNIRATLAVPEFVAWVERGYSAALASTPGFETPIEWPEGWVAKLRAEEGYGMGNLACPRFTLTLNYARCNPGRDKETLSSVREVADTVPE